MTEERKLRLKWDGWQADVGPISVTIRDGERGGHWSVWVGNLLVAREYGPASELDAKLKGEEAAWAWLNSAVEAWGGKALSSEQVGLALGAVWAQRADLLAYPEFYEKGKQLVELAQHMTVDIRAVETLASKPQGE